MLRQARNSKAAAEATQRHANAQKLVEEARAVAGSDVAAALQKLREARNLDPEIEGAAELTNSLGEQARVQGESCPDVGEEPRQPRAAPNGNQGIRARRAPAGGRAWRSQGSRLRPAASRRAEGR